MPKVLRQKFLPDVCHVFPLTGVSILFSKAQPEASGSSKRQLRMRWRTGRLLSVAPEKRDKKRMRKDPWFHQIATVRWMTQNMATPPMA